jgi:Ca2+-binding RTX toxin-like protein
MPVQKEDRRSQWTLDQPDLKWLLARNATITVSNENGIYEGTQGSEIVVNGDIKVAGNTFAGVRFMSPTSTLEVGDDSRIDARQASYGVFAEGAGQQIANHGRIESGEYGIYGALWGGVTNNGSIDATSIGVYYDEAGSRVENNGRITGMFGVVFGAGGDSELLNGKGALISSLASSVWCNANSSLTIRNDGTIRSQNYAIDAGLENSGINLVNTGRIVGNIKLGYQENYLDSRLGIIDGTVYGGKSDDTYIIAQSGLKIVEQPLSGYDEIVSYASYRLSANIESLRLRGTKDINATGSASDNILTGNLGNNTLSGGDGADVLYGRQGDDRMIGGGSADRFVFGEDYDRDRIMDFEDGLDHLYLLGVTNQQELDALDIRQSGDDVIINYGRGDQLIIEDLRKQDLTIDDLVIL